jgi:hypothetical protein
MVTLLNSAGGQPGAPGGAALAPFVAEARALIGFFSLDPNRCAAALRWREGRGGRRAAGSIATVAPLGQQQGGGAPHPQELGWHHADGRLAPVPPPRARSVCDLVLEAWEAWLAAAPGHARADVSGWLALLELFRPDAPAQLLGFRFLYHQVGGGVEVSGGRLRSCCVRRFDPASSTAPHHLWTP